jgi:hypothetical protein
MEEEEKFEDFGLSGVHFYQGAVSTRKVKLKESDVICLREKRQGVVYFLTPGVISVIPRVGT